MKHSDKYIKEYCRNTLDIDFALSYNTENNDYYYYLNDFSLRNSIKFELESLYGNVNFRGSKLIKFENSFFKIDCTLSNNINGELDEYELIKTSEKKYDEKLDFYISIDYQISKVHSYLRVDEYDKHKENLSNLSIENIIKEQHSWLEKQLQKNDLLLTPIETLHWNKIIYSLSKCRGDFWYIGINHKIGYVIEFEKKENQGSNFLGNNFCEVDTLFLEINTFTDNYYIKKVSAGKRYNVNEIFDSLNFYEYNQTNVKEDKNIEIILGLKSDGWNMISEHICELGISDF